MSFYRYKGGRDFKNRGLFQLFYGLFIPRGGKEVTGGKSRVKTYNASRLADVTKERKKARGGRQVKGTTTYTKQ
jgi:hypothetical protein